MTVSARAWPGAGKLPYFLQDAFEVRELKLLDRQIILAIDKRPGKPGLANVRGQMDKLRQLTGLPVVYVTGTLASYERKRLLALKVAVAVAKPPYLCAVGQRLHLEPCPFFSCAMALR